MTIEELITKATLSSIGLDDLEEFLSEHVCIKKGANRHQYADVLHEIAEGGEFQWSEDGENWRDATAPLYQYRIKPQEPVYEWQWYRVVDGMKDYTNRRYTEDEVMKSNLALSPMKADSTTWKKDEETKRERK